MATSKADSVEVTQADRDAAATFLGMEMNATYGIPSLGADGAVQNVARFDALIAKHGGEEK